VAPVLTTPPHRGNPGGPERETGRVEAFSDGVFAIAITLLILDIKVPRGLSGPAALMAALLDQWPAYLAFLTSFATIGIMWVNHHRLFTLIRRVDHTLLLLNGLLLLGVTFVPFPTAVLSAYIHTRAGRTAATVYSGTFTVMAIFFNLLWRYAARERRLLREEADPREVGAITRGYAFGPPLYFASLCLALVSVPASLAMDVALAMFFALPPPRRPPAARR
jgi:uncharacterized membrane protein